MDPSSEDEARSVRRQAVFRAGNEAIRANVGYVDALLLVCECGSDACFERIAIRPNEYDGVRGSLRRFVVALGHEQSSVEDAVVVDENDRFVVVEKLRTSGALAEELPPGRSHGED